MSRINSGQKLLNRLIGSKIITPSGAAWATIAADPFHDLELPELCGYPDTQVGSSVILKVPSQMTISAPAGQAGPWRFMLCTWPWTLGDSASGPLVTQYNLAGNVLLNPPIAVNNSSSLPPVSIYIANNDVNNLGPFEVGTAGNQPVVGLGLSNAYTKGVSRVIGWGVEVYDTTAVISRQGTCTVWRQNSNTYDKTLYSYASPAAGPINAWGGTLGIQLNSPPVNIAEANLLAGTKSWKSEDGAYIVMTQNQEQLLAKQPNDVQPVIFRGDITAGIRQAVGFATCISGSTAQQQVGLGTAMNFPIALWNFQPYHQSGCFFTGLSPNSTFLVRTIFYVERFPTPDEPDIVLLTKPSACHDPVALEIYDRMLKEMPVGVPVAENGLGDWFYDAISAALPLLKNVPIPLVSGLATAGETVLNSYNDYQKNNKRKQQTNPPRGPRGTSSPKQPPPRQPQKTLPAPKPKPLPKIPNKPNNK